MRLVCFDDNPVLASILSYLCTVQVSMGKGAKIKLEEKIGDKVYAECPIESYPGLAIQSVADSSRCTELRLSSTSELFPFLQVLCDKSNGRREECAPGARIC